MMTPQLTDEEIIIQLLPTQPGQCFELLYNRYANRVYRHCLSIMHDSEKAHDLTHDVFLRVFNRLSKFRHRASFSTWLYSITFNYCFDQLRLSKRFPQTPIDIMLPVPVPEPDEPRLLEIRLQLLRHGLATLSAAERLLLQQKYEDNLSILELSRLYNIGESAVKMRLKRCRDKLQAIVQTLQPESGSC